MASTDDLHVEFQYGGRLGEFYGMSSDNHLLHCRFYLYPTVITALIHLIKPELLANTVNVQTEL